MKAIKFFLLIILTFAMASCGNPNSDKTVEDNSTKTDREYYQLKVYTFDSANQVKIVDKYLKEAYLPGLKRLGINNIGVFKRKPNETDSIPDSIQKTYVLIPFSTIEQFLTVKDKLSKDEKYLEAGSDYINASYEHPPYHRIKSILLKAFQSVPVMQVPKLNNPRSERIYELRSYESATEQYNKNKLEMFNKAGEIKLQDQLGFNAIFYGEVISGAEMPNLMYMPTFSDQASRDKHWDAFFNAPEWKDLSAMSKYKNTVSHVGSNFLYPTEYSDY